MNSTQEILLSELTQAKSYIDRLLHALMELSEGLNNPKIREACSDLTEEIEKVIRDEFFNENFLDQSLIHRNNLKTARANFKILTNLLETIICFGADKKSLAIGVIRVINVIYRHAHKIHELTQAVAALDVQLPRQGFTKIVTIEKEEVQRPQEVKKVGPFTLLEGGKVDEIDDEEDEDAILPPPLFQVDIEDLLNSSQSGTVSLLGLEGKREEKYEIFLANGHKHAYKQEYPEALECFQKAKSFKETAEILTLVGWIYSLLGENEKAKNKCLKAISLDPDYGPPYNDLGSILLNEGQIEEAIKWFELAKKAPKYQNKEYPYINAGRAYMMVKSYQKAMDEFEQALDICPENDELRMTIGKIERSLQKAKSEKEDFRVNFSEDDKFHPLEDR